MSQRAVIFANGHLPDPEKVKDLVNLGDVILAADGGTLNALAADIQPSVVIGDLDSLPQELLPKLTMRGVIVWRFPPEKDSTDLELALRYSFESEYSPIVIVGALGGRTDQTLANIALMTKPEFADTNIRCDDGVEELFFIRARAEIQGRVGDTVSLLPWRAPVEGIVTDGLKYPLNGETLQPERTRGVSNEMLAEVATVSISNGLLLCVHRRN
jgi:thiamine pyrophosphokinase